MKWFIRSHIKNRLKHVHLLLTEPLPDLVSSFQKHADTYIVCDDVRLKYRLH